MENTKKDGHVYLFFFLVVVAVVVVDRVIPLWQEIELRRAIESQEWHNNKYGSLKVICRVQSSSGKVSPLVIIEGDVCSFTSESLPVLHLVHLCFLFVLGFFKLFIIIFLLLFFWREKPGSDPGKLQLQFCQSARLKLSEENTKNKSSVKLFLLLLTKSVSYYSLPLYSIELFLYSLHLLSVEAKFMNLHVMSRCIAQHI